MGEIQSCQIKGAFSPIYRASVVGSKMSNPVSNQAVAHTGRMGKML